MIQTSHTGQGEQTPAKRHKEIECRLLEALTAIRRAKTATQHLTIPADDMERAGVEQIENLCNEVKHSTDQLLSEFFQYMDQDEILSHYAQH